MIFKNNLSNWDALGYWISYFQWTEAANRIFILNIKYIGDNEGEDIGFEGIEFCLLCFFLNHICN